MFFQRFLLVCLLRPKDTSMRDRQLHGRTPSPPQLSDHLFHYHCYRDLSHIHHQDVSTQKEKELLLHCEKFICLVASYDVPWGKTVASCSREREQIREIELAYALPIA